MKKLFIFILIATSLTACKRKQSLRELDSDETLAKHPIHCYNGTQDPEETGVDCGGPCEECASTGPICSPSTNTLIIGGVTKATTASSCGVGGSGYFNMLGTYSSGNYTVSLGSGTPNLTIAYSITSSPSPNANEANVSINDGTAGSLNLSVGTVNMTEVGGIYFATICSGSAYSWSTSTTYSIEGKVSCP